MFDERVIEWLLEDNNLAVKYRTQTELLDMTADIEPVKSWLLNFLPKDWNETRGLWYRYYITAAAEAGLSKSDIPVDCFSNAFYELDKDFECGCGDFMLLTALLKFGFSGHETIQKIINKLHTLYLPDGGYLCLHRVKKLKYTPKSCYKANLQSLVVFIRVS